MKTESKASRLEAPADLGEIVERIRQISAENERLVRHLADGESRFRTLARAAWRAQEEERRSIALEMHDGLGQILTALINHLRPSRAGEESANRDEAVVLARAALSEVRRLSRALRPSVLDDLGIGAALRWLSRTTGEASNIDVRLTLPADLDLDKETETMIFRVVQEALTNVAKHSRASRCRVDVTRGDGTLRIAISDNGCGFDAQAALADGSGFGIRGMRDRAALFGGKLEIGAAPDEGTRLTLELPDPAV